ncbi:hypothetical protein P378_09340 [Desulforamulus profundi]|uniref:DUF4829 domain-containing protein n=1 Tax=Desulforamulus profundi TaxID=1383067 RepID=A0A2C6MFR3_9FIRM|nr:DUF4829 domain-containing protein [Desulforamulus profundi]PHJ38515.1 hypothetical protein P378_09340 [Desulforamulus profundi]
MDRKRIIRPTILFLIFILGLLAFLNKEIELNLRVWRSDPDEVVQMYFEGVNIKNLDLVKATLYEHGKNTIYTFDAVEYYKIISIEKDEKESQLQKNWIKYNEKGRFKKDPYDIAIYKVKYFLKLNPKADYNNGVNGVFIGQEGYGVKTICLVKLNKFSSWKIYDIG